MAEKLQPFLKKLHEKERELLIENKRSKATTMPLWKYFQAFIGYNTPRVKYADNRHVKLFSLTAEMILQWRLCDIITWTYCPNLTGPVPIHLRKSFTTPGKSVSSQYITNSDTDTNFTKSFKALGNIILFMDEACHLVSMLEQRASEPMTDIQPMADISTSCSLHALWGKFTIFHTQASATSIVANVLLASYHLGCLFEVSSYIIADAQSS